MQMKRTSRLISRIGSAALLAAIGGCSANTGESPAGPPATVADAAKVLDLATFPRVAGADPSGSRNLAGLSYNATGTVKAVFEFQRKQLTEQKWKELPDGYASDQATTGTFVRNGYTLSVMVLPSGKEGAVSVTITNHGNVDLGKLPVPPGVKPLVGGPVNASYITETPVEATAETCRKLLLEKGWRPYGAAGDVQFFKQNVVRLAARVSSAPAQGGKTVIDYSTVLMSADLPAPPDAQKLQYSDTPIQLAFDTTATDKDVAGFYRQTLGKAGWEATTGKPVTIDFKKMLIFRNPQQDMLRLELTDVDGNYLAADAATDARMDAEILAWSRAKGLFAGIALKGATLRNDADVNAELYGRKIDNREVLAGGVEPPAASQALRSALDTYSMRK